MSATTPPPLPAPLRVCLLGFGGFEKSTLASALRLATQRLPTYVLADSAADWPSVRRRDRSLPIWPRMPGLAR